mmetsp:Transcript_30145/g.22405  ORF Transcript_30145/g.22405 Transcript_30145/m.22405 type:complete len:101 (-) Transcript_30145:201-503(-)
MENSQIIAKKVKKFTLNPEDWSDFVLRGAFIVVSFPEATVDCAINLELLRKEPLESHFTFIVDDLTVTFMYGLLFVLGLFVVRRVAFSDQVEHHEVKGKP